MIFDISTHVILDEKGNQKTDFFLRIRIGKLLKRLEMSSEHILSFFWTPYEALFYILIL